MSLGIPLHDALHEKQAPHSLCGACSLEVMVRSNGYFEPSRRLGQENRSRSRGSAPRGYRDGAGVENLDLQPNGASGRSHVSQGSLGIRDSRPEFLKRRSTGFPISPKSLSISSAMSFSQHRNMRSWLQ